MNVHAPKRVVPRILLGERAPGSSNQWVGVVEGAVLIGGVFAIERLGLFDLGVLPIHPLVLAVALMAAQYGALGGIMTAVMATALALLGGMLPQRVVGEGYFEYLAAVWTTPLAWLIIAVLVGVVSDGHRRLLQRSELALFEAQKERELIAAQYEALAARAKRLERRVAGLENNS
ncbi:hypothetical protein [Pelagibacterium halotolerans]|uniref:Histidine kinase n=1 Tax=Pelagibacterium halotolerans (strain DSM 22347 / JCM 15775 / CGMCC 1.7692 / B2) TaxID=1082931 RepID=G4RAP2_PELHB|nr:hypothetical protein [Pelagibacterium halotolerans]AEQ52565.1 hypothetical protein KKY_2557 [Pelagibacterium halotolerans B2]QJR17719.1 hypothetical protein HKM20_04275 [Pelagibacterium halotolerans]SEA40246.1 hypothetical protein SAMN05428936_103305 [Pelagibacterium halotolerans]